MYVVISVKDGMADVWGTAYVKAQPLARAQVFMPAQPNTKQVIDTIDQALKLANTDGTVIFNVGHGAAAAAQCTNGACPLPGRTQPGDPTLAEGMVDLAPSAALRLGGYHVQNTFIDVFYDFNVAGPPAFSDQDNDLKFNQGNADAKKRQANWAVYQTICALFKRTSPYKVVFLTCNVGNATQFLRKIANDWGTVIEAYTSKIELSTQDNGQVRVHLERDPPNTGTNVANSEHELPLATAANSVRLGPPLPTPVPVP